MIPHIDSHFSEEFHFLLFCVGVPLGKIHVAAPIANVSLN